MPLIWSNPTESSSSPGESTSCLSESTSYRAISTIKGHGKIDASTSILIEGHGFLPDSALEIDSVIIENYQIHNPNKITATVRGITFGTFPVVVKNKNLSSSAWEGTYYLEVISFNTISQTTIVAAYSFTKINELIINCCRIRRTDGAQQDIGFDDRNKFDESSALNFTGSGDGSIVEIEDQTGNGYTASQSVVTNKPLIIDSGSIIRTNNSRPHLRHNLSDDCLEVNLPNNQT